MTKPNGGEAFPELEEGRFRERGLSGLAPTLLFPQMQEDLKMSKPDGGPAFPRPIGHNGYPDPQDHDSCGDQKGMSLRDYFAGQALAGLNTLPTSINRAWQTEVDSRGGIAALRARCAYADADAMIAERDK